MTNSRNTFSTLLCISICCGVFPSQADAVTDAAEDSLILRKYENAGPQKFPRDSFINVTRNYNKTCHIKIQQLYDVKIENASKSIYDYYIYLEACSSQEKSSCNSISRAYPKCGLRCSLDTGIYRDAFSMELDGNDPIIVVILTLDGQKHLSKGSTGTFFRLAMTPRKMEEPRFQSEVFEVSKSICSGVLSLSSGGVGGGGGGGGAVLISLTVIFGILAAAFGGILFKKLREKGNERRGDNDLEPMRVGDD